MDIVVYQETQKDLHAKRFTMYLAIASMVMMFAAFTSAYLVRRSVGNWLEFNIPQVFYFSTFIILLSSISMHVALRAFKKLKESLYKNMISFTLALGLLFVVLQYVGWKELNLMGVELQTNPSASFLFLISGLHAAHVLGGVGALIATAIRAYKTRLLVVSPRRLNNLRMVAIYWHFVDILWIYLLLFFVLQ